MTRSAPATFDWNSSVIALLVIGSIRWLYDSILMIASESSHKDRKDHEEIPKCFECETRPDETLSLRAECVIFESFAFFAVGGVRFSYNAKVSDGSQPPMAFDLTPQRNGWLPFAAPSGSTIQSCSRQSCFGSTGISPPTQPLYHIWVRILNRR